MTSKAERSRMKKARGLPARRGRALVPGQARYPSGKLKPRPAEPEKPNELLVGARLRLAGPPADWPRGATESQAIAAAENPLDLAKFRGWIGTNEHRAGELLIETYRKAGLDLPDIRVQDLNRVAKGHATGQGDASKMNHLRDIAKALHFWPKCRRAVFSLVILREWPAWMLTRIAGEPIRGYEGVGRVHLIVGLKTVGKVLGVGVVEDRRAA